MTTKTIELYTEEDKKLLNTPLPKNPCKNGCAGHRCTYCFDYSEYENTIDAYRKANILEKAEDIQRIDDLRDKILQMAQEYNELRAKLPEFVQRPAANVMFD